MNPIFAVAGLILLAGIFVSLTDFVRREPRKRPYQDSLRGWEPPKEKQLPNTYTPKGIILSPTEQTFFKVLQEAAGPEYGISLKMRLADILSPKGRGKQFHCDFNRIKAKHIDFLLYDSKTFQIAAAVELDDQSHNSLQRIERDEFVDDAFSHAGIPLCRFQAKASYNPHAVAEKISDRLDSEKEQDPSADWKTADSEQEQRKNVRYMPPIASVSRW